MSDDELRELFERGHAEDRAAAPPFEQLWRDPESVRRPRRIAGFALAAAAIALIAFGWIMRDTPDVQLSVPHLAVNPLPDLPADEPDDGPAELAAWQPSSFDAPTDFLLDDNDSLAGGLPSGDLDDAVLDLEHLTMEL